jgi:hypothetical protein
MMFTIHHFPDPSIPNTNRPYLIRQVSPCASTGTNATPDSSSSPRNRYQLCEITRIDCSDETMDSATKFESYILPSTELHASPPYVIQDGSLYAVTPVDPLFWFLPDRSLRESLKPAVWEPLSQVIQQFDPVLVSCLSDELQLRHLFSEMHIEDHEPLVQFSVESALLWLQSKQEHVELTLLDQAQSQLSQSKKANGAFCSGFTISDSTTTEALPCPDENTTPSSAKPFSRNESIQLICQYLSPGWRERFLLHLQVDAALVLQVSPERRKRPKVMMNDGPEQWHATNGASDTAPAAPTAKPMTAGAKRLLKATSNTRGLQTISSFFQKGKSK